MLKVIKKFMLEDEMVGKRCTGENTLEKQQRLTLFVSFTDWNKLIANI